MVRSGLAKARRATAEALSLPTPVNSQPTNQSRLFWGCFIALVTCAFGFIVRTQIIGDWQKQFNLTETDKGNILGVGFWPAVVAAWCFPLTGFFQFWLGYYLSFTRQLPTGAAIVAASALFLLPGALRRLFGRPA